MDKPVWSIDQIVENLDRANIAWLSQPVSYSFLNAVPPGDWGDPAYSGFSAFLASQRSATHLAFDLYADVIDVDFVHAADGPSSNNRITFANSSTMPSYVWGWTQIAWGNSSSGSESSIDSAEIWVNSSNGTAYNAGSYNFIAVLHEIGHALGLSHPGDYNADGNPITYLDDALYVQDSRQYTVMSYFDAENTGANHQGQFASTPLLHDVAALQAIYGANMTTRTGDTVYGFHSNAGRAPLDFSINQHPVVAIWDAGGIDTIDLSGFTPGCVLDLNQGAFSDVNGLTQNLAICFGVTIENAVGGQGNDRILGNTVANEINAGSGDDYVDARGGDDTISGNEGNDALVGGHGDDIIDPGIGDDMVSGGTGDDILALSAAFTAGDIIDGGVGFDTLTLTGDYSAGSALLAPHLAAVEKIVLGSGYSYEFALDDTSVAAHKTLVLDASALGTEDMLHFLGGAGNNGRFTITAGSGDDILSGGAGKDKVFAGGGDDVVTGFRGADVLAGEEGADTFIYTSVLDSNAAAVDKIIGFDAISDAFDLWFSVTGLDAGVEVRRPAQIEAALDSGHLGAHHAVLVTTNKAYYLVIDSNGIAGYQVTEDIPIKLYAPVDMDQLSLTNFI